jgi:hypothetical protein
MSQLPHSMSFGPEFVDYGAGVNGIPSYYSYR